MATLAMKPTTTLPSTNRKRRPAKGILKPKVPVPGVASKGNRAKQDLNPSVDVPALSCQLQELQRQRVCNLKSQIMLDNRLVATVATASGYFAAMDEKQRKHRFDAARKMIDEVKGESACESESARALPPCSALIRAASIGIDGFDVQVVAYEKAMERLAKQLPVYDWLCRPEQRGFGLLSLAKVIGETGDLTNYPNPGKLWRRMGCAPFESKGRMLMPSTWRREKPGLSSAEWEECGYSPRRRSLAYLIGEGLMKQNGPGPYRARYDAAKQRAAEVHEDWKPLRCHLHGMLLATKFLLKALWIEWTGGDTSYESERRRAAVHSVSKETAR